MTNAMRRGAINKRGIFPRLTGYICVLLTVFVWGCNLGDSSTPEVTYGTPVDPEILFPPEDSRTPPKDSRMDSLAKCLTAKGAVVYGSSRCSRTKRQIEAFGEAFNHIVYVNCIASEEACDAKGIRSYPTWIIKGRKFPSFLSPTVLADLAGCD